MGRHKRLKERNGETASGRNGDFKKETEKRRGRESEKEKVVCSLPDSPIPRFSDSSSEDSPVLRFTLNY
jgi:hypothetical protein